MVCKTTGLWVCRDTRGRTEALGEDLDVTDVFLALRESRLLSV